MGGDELEASVSDVELIDKCLNGNSEAFSELVSRYKRLIYKVVYNIINNEQEVNDISQEVFLKFINLFILIKRVQIFNLGCKNSYKLLSGRSEEKEN
jgi:hypothetical protein